MENANEMTQSEIEDILEEDMHGQFEDMYYTVKCETCDKRITDVLLLRDVEKDSRTTQDFFLELLEHNMTHYKKPIGVRDGIPIF
tara:strand:- start:191 stop:445 length:255 start_codon:yes stop_codon:yes gene_type:complete